MVVVVLVVSIKIFPILRHIIRLCIQGFVSWVPPCNEVNCSSCSLYRRGDQNSERLGKQLVSRFTAIGKELEVLKCRFCIILQLFFSSYEHSVSSLILCNHPFPISCLRSLAFSSFNNPSLGDFNLFYFLTVHRNKC